jgi:hypothetical protein
MSLSVSVDEGMGVLKAREGFQEVQSKMTRAWEGDCWCMPVIPATLQTEIIVQGWPRQKHETLSEKYTKTKELEVWLRW